MLVCHPGLLNPLWLGCHPGGSGMPAPLWTADPPWLLFPCLPQGPLPRLPLVWVHTRPASVIVFPLPSVPCTPTSLSLACALSPRALLFPLTSWCHSPEDYGGGLSPHPCLHPPLAPFPQSYFGPCPALRTWQLLPSHPGTLRELPVLGFRARPPAASAFLIFPSPPFRLHTPRG